MTPFKILVVDDDEAVREALVLELSVLPFAEVVGDASDGAEAIERTATASPDIVLMDVDMPGMDGEEATRAIKRRFPDVHVVGMSATDDARAAKRMVAAGATAFLVKRDLSRLVRTAWSSADAVSTDAR